VLIDIATNLLTLRNIMHVFQQTFSTQFQDFIKYEGTFTFVSSPVGDANVRTVLDDFQLEIMASQCNKN